MIYRVNVEHVNFDFDNVQDAAAFANIAASRGTYMNYDENGEKTPKPAKVTIELLPEKEETPTTN